MGEHPESVFSATWTIALSWCLQLHKNKADLPHPPTHLSPLSLCLPQAVREAYWGEQAQSLAWAQTLAAASVCPVSSTEYLDIKPPPVRENTIFNVH